MRARRCEAVQDRQTRPNSICPRQTHGKLRPRHWVATTGLTAVWLQVCSAAARCRPHSSGSRPGSWKTQGFGAATPCWRRFIQRSSARSCCLLRSTKRSSHCRRSAGSSIRHNLHGGHASTSQMRAAARLHREPAEVSDDPNRARAGERMNEHLPARLRHRRASVLRKAVAIGAATVPPKLSFVSATRTANARFPCQPMNHACVRGGTSLPYSAVPVLP